MNKKQNVDKLRLEENTSPFQAERSGLICGTGPLHYHNYIELELITQGQGSQIVNGKQVPLSVGDIYVLRPLDSHQIYGENLVIEKFIVSESILGEQILFKLYTIINPLIVHLDSDEFAAVASIMRAAEKEQRDPAEYSNVLCSKILEIPFLYYLRKAELTSRRNLSHSFYNILYYIHEKERYLQPISLKDIAGYSNYSETYISKLFHKQYGLTFTAYLISLRIEHAKRLLLNTDLPIQEICIRSGFSSFPNFINMFKRLTELTPKDFRKTYRI